jgi:hypothetical protein
VDLVQLASSFCDQVRSGLDPFFWLERLRQITGAVAGANLAVGYQCSEVLESGALWFLGRHLPGILAQDDRGEPDQVPRRPF